jgi:hypothetical protein
LPIFGRFVAQIIGPIHVAPHIGLHSFCGMQLKDLRSAPGSHHRDTHHRRLLRARRERPCSRRAAEKRDEFPPFHSITSSRARAAPRPMPRFAREPPSRISSAT